MNAPVARARLRSACGALALTAIFAPAIAHARVHPGFIDMMTDSNRIVSLPSTARPPYRVPVTEPTFGTQLTRIAGNTGTSIGGGMSGTWGSDVRHHYSKEQPWNADGSLMVIFNGSDIVFLDGETYEPRFGRCDNYPQNDDRWHPTLAHKNERINVRGTQLIWHDVVNCVRTRQWTLPFSVSDFGPSEGNTSHDGRFIALTDGARMFVVDMDPQAPFAPYPASRIGPAVRIDECGLSGGCRIDWVSVSASGKYVVINYDGDHPRVFDVNPATLELTPRVMPSGAPRCSGGAAAKGFIYDVGHSDMTLNPFDGNEDVIIGQEHCGNQGRTVNGVLMGGVAMVRLKDGAVTSLTNPDQEDNPHHISTRNYDRPGWAYVGYRMDHSGKFTDEIIAVKMDGSKTVQRFAHKHSAFESNYRSESHAVPSRDGRRVVFGSNWTRNCVSCGSSSDIKPFLVDARSGVVVPDVIPPDAITDLEFP